MKKIQAGVDMEPSSCSLQFIVLEYDMQTSGEKKMIFILLDYSSTLLYKLSNKQIIPTHVSVVSHQD